MSFTESDVQNALKNLIDPNTKKDFRQRQIRQEHQEWTATT